MGKGARARELRTEDKTVAPEKYVKKKSGDRSGFWWAVVLIAVAVILAGVLVFNMLSNSGLFLRSGKAMSTKDFSVDGAMMSYFVHSSYSDYIQYIESMLSGNYSAAALLGINTAQSLKNQVRDKDSGQTWFEYFADMAKTQVERILVYCQSAHDAGVSLDDDDRSAIDANIQLLKLYAKQSGYTLTNYLARMYGTGVSEKDVRRAMELSALASKYQTQLQDGFKEASTDEKVNAFFDKNKNDYLTADYLLFKITAKKGSITSTTTDEEKEKIEAEYKESKEKAEKRAAELLEMKTADEFKDKIREYVIEDNAEYRKQKYETYLKSAEGETDEEKEAYANKKADEDVAALADAQIDKLLVEGQKYNKTTELGKWIFGDGEDVEPAKVNDTHKEETKSDDDTSYAVSIYLLTRESSKDETLARNISYLVLPASGYSESDAKAALEAFRSGSTVDGEALVKLAEKYEKASGKGTEENVLKGTFGVDDVDNWLFDEERKAGDNDLITYEYSDATYYMLVYVDGLGDATWYVNCENGMLDSELSDWYDAALTKCGVRTNMSVINRVSL